MSSTKISYKPGSFFQVPNREIYRSLKPNAKVVYVAICDYADESGSCYPSRKTLATDTGISVRSVDGAIKELVAAGVIEKQERKKEGGDNFSNVYQIMMVATDEGGAAPALGGAAVTPRGAGNSTLTIPTELQPKNDKTLTDVSEAEPEVFGNPTINAMVAIFEEANGTKLRLIAKQRRAAQHIIRRTGSDEKAIGVCKAAVACRREPYAPAISNLLDLHEKLDKLAVYYSRKNSPKVAVGVVQ
jgi:hypothetical protein